MTSELNGAGFQEGMLPISVPVRFRLGKLKNGMKGWVDLEQFGQRDTSDPETHRKE